MYKLIEKTKKLMIILLVAAIAFTVTTANTNAIANSITIGDAEDIPAYIGGVTFATKTTTDGKYLYCLEMTKKTTMNTVATLKGERDAGIAYIISNGYPNKSFTGDRLKDYYITQTAIWWYLDETTGTMNLGEQFKSEGSDPHKMRQYVKDLVDAGLKANSEGYKKITIAANTNDTRLKLDGEYYSSSTIEVSTNADTYTVTLEGAPENTKVFQASSNEEKTTLSKGENFIIKVPANGIKEKDLSFKVNITANGVVYKAYEYKPENENMQAVGTVEPSEEKVTTSLDLGVVTSKVTIIKYDSATNQILAGAKLVLKDSDGNEVTNWISTTNAHVIRNLSNGEYTVSELAAPNGYKLSNEVVKFTINEKSDDILVKFYNQPEDKTIIDIPDTSTSSLLFFILGMTIIGSGLGFVYKNAKSAK